MQDIRGRLEEALQRSGLSILQLQVRLRERGVTGASYGSIYAYFKGSVDKGPPLEFLRAAADILGVREEWLILGNGGPTADEDTIRETETALMESNQTQQQSELWRMLAQNIPGLLNWPRAARAVFCEAWVRYTMGFHAPHLTEYQMGRMARYLFDLVIRPLREPGLRRPFGTELKPEDLDDYLVLTMQSLMRAMPAAKQGEYPDPDLFPSREADSPQRPPRRDRKADRIRKSRARAKA
jgi:hypothetical protein